MPPVEISAAQAARIALVAQGFADRRPSGAVTAAHLARVIGRTKLIQMDSVNVAVRAHYLPMFSRLGAYDRAVLDRAAWPARPDSRVLVEYWAHEAALIPVADWPLFTWRMDEFRDGRYRETQELMRRNRALAADVRSVIADVGPATPRLIEEHLGIARVPRSSAGWWDHRDVKHLCEAMFAAGDLTATRDGNFARHYDLTERVIGEIAHRSVDRASAHRALVSRAAAALGIATAADLADYYRLKAAQVRPAIVDLIDSGVLQQVSVEGWREPAYLHADAVVPRRVASAPTRSAVLSPFDPLIFYRPRAQRLFDFHYRIEIYVPEHKRVHGYYVHPYLLGDAIVARVDLKADRAAGILRVPAAYVEPGHDAAVVASRLAADLAVMANWLGLDGVVVGTKGNVASQLSAETRRASP
ncbi:MAG: crosslink repair DNA glycosylase YcaQ family protein [Gordonia sp. (in: high G+C Gram-positive bacteria)]